MKKDCILYLGNGFDVACGLKTKYSQFIESDIYFQLEKTNALAHWIKSQYNKDKDRWSDLEELIFYYSLYLQNSYRDYSSLQRATAIFQEEFKQLSLALQDYISDQSKGEHPKYISMLIDSWNDLLKIEGICCFNYTPFPVLMKLLPNYNKLYRIHGALTPTIKVPTIRIKLGIDRCMKVCPEHSFLYKDNMPNYTPGIWTEPDNRLIAAAKITNEPIYPAFYNAEVIIIYGCSLGRSDTAYFKYLFSNAKTQRIIIYHFGENEEIIFRRRVPELTDDNDIYKRIRFIDSSKDNGYLRNLEQFL